MSPPEASADRFGPPMELVERIDELAALHAALDEARAGTGKTVFVCGEAGIGKTRLIRTFLDQVSDGVVVLTGECDDLIAPRLFGPFRDMARTSGHLPRELEADPDPDLLLMSLLDVLRSGLRPTIVVIEDAQWIDDASLDVVRYLVRRMSGFHGLLLLSVRHNELAERHPLHGLAGGPSDRPPLKLVLGPLSQQGVATLATGSDFEPEQLWAASGGNPFYLAELLASRTAELPFSIRDTIIGRAARVPEPGRSALQILSVIPAGADPSLARALFGDDPMALEQAEASGLLVSTPDRIRFRHELGRRAVEGSLSFGRRLACNRQVLDALGSTGTDTTTLVHIARAAGDAARATAFAIQTLQEGLVPTSHREVWTLSRIALEYTKDLDPFEVANLHVQAARAGSATNRQSEARNHANAAVRILTAQGQKLPELATALMTSAVLSAALGEQARSWDDFERARQILEAHPVCEDLATCYAGLGGTSMVVGRYEEAIHWSNLAITLSEDNQWPVEVLRGLGIRGVARVSLGDEGGYEDLRRARELGAVHGPVDRHIINLYNTAVCLLRWGRPREAEPMLDEAERLAREHNFANQLYQVHVQRGLMLILRGEIDVAEEMLEDLITRRSSDPGAIVSTAYAFLGRIYARRGDPRWKETVETGWRVAKNTGEDQKIAVAGITKLESAWLEQDDDLLRSLAAELLELADRSSHLRLRAEALRYLMRIGEEVEPFDGCPEGHYAALSGDSPMAAAIWEAAGQPYEQALELAESHDPSMAFEGLRILDRLGATRTADLVRSRLRSRGFQSVPRGPRKGSDGSVAVLTDRQREVVRLIGQGLTNQEIAEELFVARRTVDNHVSAILTRLGVESRHAAVEEAAARGLLDGH